MLTKKQQDAAWRSLPKDFKEEVKDYYQATQLTGLQQAEDVYRADRYAEVMEAIFGKHNLTSDECDKAEPKFKVGDKVNVIGGAIKSDSVMGIITDAYAYDEPGNYGVRVGKSFWVLSEKDLEPYTEPQSQNSDENCDSENLISKSDDMEEKELSLCEILRGREGIEIYDTQEGLVTLLEVGEVSICVNGPNGKIHYLRSCITPFRSGGMRFYPSRDLYLKYPLDARAAWMEWKQANKRKYILQAQIRLIPNNGMTIEDLEIIEVETYDDDMTQAAEAVRKCLEEFHEKNSKQ